MPGLPVRQIETAPLHGRVYDELRRALISGQFSPGQKLTSRGLASMLGTSDMPVRAALGRMVAEGGLVQRPNGTIAVPIVGRDKFREIMELRALLEGRATGLACGEIDATGFRKLDGLSRNLAEAIHREDIVLYLDVNQKLKFTIYSYCASPTLLTLIEFLWLQAGPVLRHLSVGLKVISQLNFHDDAIEALRRKDALAAAAAISHDITEGMRYLLEMAHFSEDGEPATIAAKVPEC